MQEIYKIHPKGYLVSNFGRIKGKNVEFLKNHASNGYCYVTIGLVHRVVWETFVGEIPKDYQINHLDYNKSNNRLDNLECVTASENMKHCKRNPKHKSSKGSLHPNSTISENDIIIIYNMILDGESNEAIGCKYNLHPRYISLIRHGKRWKHTYANFFKNKSIPISGSNSPIELKIILKIIHLTLNSKMTNKEISEKYSIDPSTISRIRYKKLYKYAWAIYTNNLSKGIIAMNTEIIESEFNQFRNGGL